MHKQWADMWMQPPAVTHPMIDNLPSSQVFSPEIALSPSDLHKLAQLAKGKAAGPDGWKGQYFAALPVSAFKPLLEIWNKC